MNVWLKKYSIANDIPIETWILEYPRLIHSELLTHRVFSRNAASSRAIPTKAIIENIRENPADIVWWGKAMSGMQAKEELSGWQLKLAKFGWALGRECAITIARFLNAVGLHKQIANRGLETYQNIRVVVTSTEWNNFYALRNHPDAQPEFRALASMMAKIRDQSFPERLEPGEWHIPYIPTTRMAHGRIAYLQPVAEGLTPWVEISLEAALRISASMAAQESYRKSDPTLDKARQIYGRLVDSAPVHASPTEHQAQAMKHTNLANVSSQLDHDNPLHYMQNIEGTTHMDKTGNFWSGNFRGWIQHRQLIPNHHVPG